MKQKRLPFVGAIKITWTHTAVYVNLITFFLTTAIFWHTTGSHWMQNEFGWHLPYYAFLLIVVGIIATFSLIFVYRFDVPSTLGWYYDQLCKHSYVYKDDIAEIKSLLRIRNHRRWKYYKGGII